MSSWQIVLLEPARQMFIQLGNFLLKAFSVVIILILGWLIARLIKELLTKALVAIKLDQFSDWIELDTILEKGGIKYSLSELIGLITYWLIIFVTFVVTLSAVNLIPPSLLDSIVLYVPNVIAAIFVLILGMFVATVLKNIVLTAANNAGISYSNLLSKITGTIIVVFSVAIALEQLQIGIRITQLTVAIVLGTIGLGVGLAFGLGCKEIAGKFVGELIEKLKKK